MKQLWAPWRLEYIKSADEELGCVFCLAAEGDDEERLVVYGDLTDEEALELHRLASDGMDALAQLDEPQGYNVGWNLGRSAGAGVVDHVHMHVVPRWGGDTNFMPVLADVKVLPEHLAETRRRLVGAWPAA